MGCGASTLVRPPPTSTLSEGQSDLLNNNLNERKVGVLINGINLSHKLITKTNSVSPLNENENTKCANEKTEKTNEKTNEKVVKKQSSSSSSAAQNLIQSSSNEVTKVEGSTNQVENSQVPTNQISKNEVSNVSSVHHVIKRVLIKDKGVQCTHLLPEDELDVLMQEDAYLSDEIQRDAIEKFNSKRGTIDSKRGKFDSEREESEECANINTMNGMTESKSCQTIVSLQCKQSLLNGKHEETVSDKLRGRRFHTTKDGDVTSQYNGQRSEEEDESSDLSPIQVTLSEEEGEGGGREEEGEEGGGSDLSLSRLLSPDHLPSSDIDAKIRDANLRDTKFCGANLEDANLRDAKFIGARFGESRHEKKSSSSSSESQTDPMTTAVAATSGGNDPSIASVMIHSLDVTSPLSHIEKELNSSCSNCIKCSSCIKCSNCPTSIGNETIIPDDCPDCSTCPNCSSASIKSRKFDEKLQACLNQLLHDTDRDDTEDEKKRVVKKRDASVQTYNDPITDESPEFAARPPPSRKREMIPSIQMFKEIDEKVIKASDQEWDCIKSLVHHLIADTPNELFRVRALFRWITNNMKYNWNFMGKNYSPNELFRLKQGICKDYCILFGEMCHLAGIRVKLIQGFAKGFDHKPGYCFKPGRMAIERKSPENSKNPERENTGKENPERENTGKESSRIRGKETRDVEVISSSEDRDLTHTWNAVYIFGSWRLIDTTWGTGYTDHSGQFQLKLNEHFFLTDPEVLIWSHFPFDPNEANYHRWQLLDKPLTLQQFNDLPKVTPSFFDFNLKIRSKVSSPITFKIQSEIKVASHEAMRYKCKLYPADEVENSTLNHFVFCCLKEDRLVGSFTVTPPVEGRYYLKVYAKPEREMLAGQADSSSLHSVVTFVLECIKSRRYIEPFPLNELPWGPTQAFYNYKMKLHNQTGPVILSWGGKRKLVIESVEQMLTTLQLFDSEGMEMDLRIYVLHEERSTGQGQTMSFTITPPRQGMFKFLLFGMPKPKQKGKWRLPLLASFLVDCKIARITKKDPGEEDPPPVIAAYGTQSHYSSTSTSIASSSSSTTVPPAITTVASNLPSTSH